MNIASVTFAPRVNNIGGAVIPAIAFSKWCTILGIESDVIGYVPKKDIDKEDIISGIDYLACDEDKLNEYDAIFFSTPIWQVEFDISKINKPFVVMIHGEGDYDLYHAKIISSMLLHKKCADVVHIDPNNQNNLFWYPCTYPENLINFKDNPTPLGPKKYNGLLYAARIRRWLNVDYFIEVARLTSCLFSNNKHIYGPCSNADTANRVAEKAKDTNINVEIDPFEMGAPYRTKTNMFWDVAGSRQNKVKFKRLSLSAYESISHGYMPIVHLFSAPTFMQSSLICIDYDDAYGAVKALEQYLNNIDAYWEQLNEVLYNSAYTYSANKIMVERIISKLTKRPI